MRWLSVFDRGVPTFRYDVLDLCTDLICIHIRQIRKSFKLTALRSIAQACQRGDFPPDAIDEAMIAANLATGDCPDPDLIIRTSGEVRLSNFLLWQCAYAEMHFTEVLWPDFTVDHLKAALDEFEGRERRYGGR